MSFCVLCCLIFLTGPDGALTVETTAGLEDRALPPKSCLSSSSALPSESDSDSEDTIMLSTPEVWSLPLIPIPLSPDPCPLVCSPTPSAPRSLATASLSRALRASVSRRRCSMNAFASCSFLSWLGATSFGLIEYWPTCGLLFSRIGALCPKP